ncbi:MAG TPA: hypothetical protein V6D33_11470 [Cyanophyceae cyanobacterium]
MSCPVDKQAMKISSPCPLSVQNRTYARPKFSRLVSQSLLLLSIGWATLLLPSFQQVSAQTSSALKPSDAPLEISLLEPDAPPPKPGIVTSRTISQTGITNPSLWWAEEQFDEFNGKLLTNWIAYQDEKRVDLVVSPQPWTLLDYLGRYRFVNQFGTVARDYDYNVRIFNPQGNLLATYTCDYSQALPMCEIVIPESWGQDSLPVRRQ